MSKSCFISQPAVILIFFSRTCSDKCQQEDHWIHAPIHACSACFLPRHVCTATSSWQTNGLQHFALFTVTPSGVSLSLPIPINFLEKTLSWHYLSLHSQWFIIFQFPLLIRVQILRIHSFGESAPYNTLIQFADPRLFQQLVTFQSTY